MYFILPNTVGAALHRETGGKAEDLFPLYEYQDSHAKAEVGSGPVKASAFYSDGTNTADSVSGVSLRTDRLQYRGFGMDAGVALYQAKYKENTTSGFFYRYKLDASPTFKGKDGIRVTPSVSVAHEGARYKATPIGSDVAGSASNDYFFNLAAGMKVETPSHKVAIKTETQFFPQKDARTGQNSEIGTSFTPPIITVEYDVQKKITEDVKGEVKVTTSVVFLPSGVHHNARVTAKVSGKQGQASVTACGSIRKDTPLYIPGAGRCLQGSFEVRVAQGVLVGATVGVQECGGGYCSFGTAGLSVSR